MKLNRRQIKLIAKQIHKKLTSKPVVLTPEQKSMVKDFVMSYSYLEKEAKKLEAKQEVLRNNLKKEVGALHLISDWRATKEKDVLEYVKDSITKEVSLDAIEDTIELSAIFSNEKDLNKFIEDMTKKFMDKNAE